MQLRRASGRLHTDGSEKILKFCGLWLMQSYRSGGYLSCRKEPSILASVSWSLNNMRTEIVIVGRRRRCSPGLPYLLMSRKLE
jgi:hypothetical protein